MPKRAIESESFPFEKLSQVAELESYRKEIYRPIYHLHKWWAQRLGSIFRATIIGAAAPANSAVDQLYLQPVRLDPNLVVYDPFMGSGTIPGEAHKLGAATIGVDINPVAVRAVKIALGKTDKEKTIQLFEQLEQQLSKQLRKYHQTKDAAGRPAEALYWFWVRQLPCPSCQTPVDLFSTRVIAKHAYVKKHPTVQVCCPGCRYVFPSNYQNEVDQCPACKLEFPIHEGPVKRTHADCPSCEEHFPIAETARGLDAAPQYSLYGKLVLDGEGHKSYLPVSEEDLENYAACKEALEDKRASVPNLPIEYGFNTRQILAHGFRYWHQLFNARQLLGLIELGEKIKALPDSAESRALALLFSSVLEFNNMFASYKGEGTGAVRHMFSHHILKPERCPIEANLWGTPKSSGAFSTLFKRRLLNALAYKEQPFELSLPDAGSKKGQKVYGLSDSIAAPLLEELPQAGLNYPETILWAKDAKDSGLPDQSVDLVVTDPPFFDNVHYSELADFFEAWREVYSGAAAQSTRNEGEVQDIDSSAFEGKLSEVFMDCHRVLKDDGLMVFSYHHSRNDGWSAVASAVIEAGFRFVEAHPVKAELSLATPKSQTKEPIDIDILLVCRKAQVDDRNRLAASKALAIASGKAALKTQRLRASGRKLSRADLRVLLCSQLLVQLSAGRGPHEFKQAFESSLPQVSPLVEALAQAQSKPKAEPETRPAEQLDLFG